VTTGWCSISERIFKQPRRGWNLIPLQLIYCCLPTLFENDDEILAGPFFVPPRSTCFENICRLSTGRRERYCTVVCLHPTPGHARCSPMERAEARERKSGGVAATSDRAARFGISYDSRIK